MMVSKQIGIMLAVSCALCVSSLNTSHEWEAKKRARWAFFDSATANSPSATVNIHAINFMNRFKDVLAEAKWDRDNNDKWNPFYKMDLNGQIEKLEYRIQRMWWLDQDVEATRLWWLTAGSHETYEVRALRAYRVLKNDPGASLADLKNHLVVNNGWSIMDWASLLQLPANFQLAAVTPAPANVDPAPASDPENENTCCICMENPSDIVLFGAKQGADYTCMHKCMCRQCADTMRQGPESQRKCPICRTRVVRYALVDSLPKHMQNKIFN